MTLNKPANYNGMAGFDIPAAPASLPLDEAMRQATATILDCMREGVLWIDDSLPAYPAGYPLIWDINNGLCEDWGIEVEYLCPDVWGEWLPDDSVSHYAVTNGLAWYDAECPDGVEDWHDLPMFGSNPRVPPLEQELTITLKGHKA